MTQALKKSKPEKTVPPKQQEVPAQKTPTKRKQARAIEEPDGSIITPSLVHKENKETPHNQELGHRGEIAATRFLERKGYYIHDRNWKCSAGEVDIVAEDEDVLVFVEVKTRSNCDKGLPEEAVDAKKRRRYEKIAAYYLREHEFVEKVIRFDVVSILVVGDDRAFLRHHCNAFAVGE